MSRFFAGGSDESDNDNDQAFEEEEEVDQRAAGARFSAVTRHFESSSDEEDEKRVVKSEKDKRWEQMLSSIRTIRNHMKINDWQALAKDFDTLNKQLSAAKSVVAKEGIPKFYFRIVIALENFLNESFTAMKAEKTDTSGKKKFNALNAKALNAMKQKLRKNRTQYQDGYTAYEKDPLPDGDDEAPEKPAKAAKAPKDDDDFGPTFEEEDEDDKGSESDAMSVSSDDSDIDLDKEITRDFWLKKDDDFGKDEASKKEERIKRQAAREERRAARMLEAENEENDERKKPVSKEKDIDYTPEMVLKKLTELLSKFGRRGTDKVAMIEDLTLLSNKAKDPAALVKVKTTLAAALFDANINAGDYMAVTHWKSCFHVLEDVIELLKVNPNVRLSEDEQIDETILDDDLDAEEVGDKPTTAAVPPPVSSESLIEERAVENAPPGQDKLQYVTGNLHSFITRLHLEYRKSLQYMDPHSPEYISRLQDEPLMVRLIDRAQVYYHGIGKMQVEVGVTLLRMEYASYRYRTEHDALLKESKEPSPAPTSALSKRTLVDELAAFVYKQGDHRAKTRALLLHIYHMALHNRWNEARDLMLMSRIQDTVHEQDIRTRVLFNRAMAQLGLCAFRVGEFRACLQCLGELFLSNKVKELLAQGVNIQRWTERDLEKEKQEKLRQLPYHMHLNMDALEGAHLVCAMLAEVPNMALHGSQNRRKVISKVFRRLFDHHSKQAFNGPPENTRELVMAATKALQKGDWARCIDYVNKMRLWDLVPNSAPIKEALSLRIREEGVKTYVLTYAGHYMSVGMPFLSQMFNLPERNVYKLLSTMMVNEQLQGAWDQPSNCLVMQSTEPSRLQRAALKYADRVSVFVEQNEKLLDQRGFYNKEERGPRDGERGQKKGWVDFRKDGRQGGDRDRRGGNRNERNERGGDRDRERRPRENRDNRDQHRDRDQQQQQRHREDREEALEQDD